MNITSILLFLVIEGGLGGGGNIIYLNSFFFITDEYLPVGRFETCYQIALAMKDEVQDLEKAGITVIQIDEPALREGLPLRNSEQAFYLDWAIRSFRITNCTVQDTTQVPSSLINH